VFKGVSDEATAEAIAQLMGAGAITAEPGIEGWVRERYGLPIKEETDDEAEASPPGVGREAEQGNPEGPAAEEEPAEDGQGR
jgi:hypothetical protein